MHLPDSLVSAIKVSPDLVPLLSAHEPVVGLNLRTSTALQSCQLTFFCLQSGHCGKLASLLKQPSGQVGARCTSHTHTPHHLSLSCPDIQRLLNAHHPLTGDTPLIIAARTGIKEAVSILLNNGADATLENESGESALDVAAPETKRVIMG